MRITSLFLILSLIVISSCHTHKKLAYQDVSLDTVSISAKNNPYKIYRATTQKAWEIEQTKIQLSFNWKEKTAEGIATLKMHAYYFAADSLWLDAKSMKIYSVTGNDGRELKFEYKNDSLLIRLGKVYLANAPLELVIKYQAQPYAEASGGSAAIKEDRGLYFINTDYKIPGKPAQIWTQGESESNSHWFPTIDKPNQRSRFEIALTVPDSFTTLSNGHMIRSEKKGNERVDVWDMSSPIQVYAAMFAIGKFAIVNDGRWEGKDINYYVEKEYEPYAKLMFKNTPEMVGFFSDITGLMFPWNKYSQVVVRDYVSGAMENTSASLFGEFLNQNAREIADKDNEDVVSHELFHQWFGDYVTFESWSNLTLSESFATYGEYLWREHKYGAESVDVLRFDDLNRYLNASDFSDPPLVRFYYRDREQMFDRVSYQKGGAVLHYLHSLMGDTSFYRTMKTYLTKNALQSAEATQWRLAAEEVTGQDWTWFFNEFYYHGGHPVLYVDYDYDDYGQKLNVTVRQKQADSSFMFQLPLKTAIVYNGVTKVIDWNITKKKETFTYPYQNGDKPLIVPDINHVMVGELLEKKQTAQWLAQYKVCHDYISKRRAIANAIELYEDNDTQEMLHLALRDEFASIRAYTLLKLQKETEKREDFKNEVLKLAATDANNKVRAAAYDLVAAWKLQTDQANVIKAVGDSSYAVAGAALSALYMLNKDTAYYFAKQLFNSNPKGELQQNIWEITGKEGKDADLQLFANQAPHVYGIKKIELASGLQYLLGNMKDDANYEHGLQVLSQLAIDESIKGYRTTIGSFVFGAEKDLKDKKKKADNSKRLAMVKKYEQQIIDAETDPDAKAKFVSMQKKGE